MDSSWWLEYYCSRVAGPLQYYEITVHHWLRTCCVGDCMQWTPYLLPTSEQEKDVGMSTRATRMSVLHMTEVTSSMLPIASDTVQVVTYS